MEGMSAAAIEVLVQNLINVSKEERSLIRGLNQDAEQLQTTLGMIRGYLNDAENKSITQDAVKIWLRKLEAVAFDADNVLDGLSYHLLRIKVKKIKTPKDKVLSFFSSLDHIARSPPYMAHTIKQINTDFESMNRRATELGLQSIVVNAPAAPDASFETDSLTLDPIFIGRDDDVPKLVEKLTKIRVEERMLSVLAIVGMGGMGKTTLTRKVFNHEKMKTGFGSHIWVHVSQTFDPVVLFKKILSTLASQTIDGGVENMEVILRRLQEALKAKTYLLVLDDVWNQDLPRWEDFINSLSGVTSTNGNAIIMTTRNEKVASIARPLHIHFLNGLSNEDCWSIIKAKTFENGDAPSGFEMIERKIAKRCQGLPLAANVVGGVLRDKSEKDWLSIEQKWLSDGEGGETISKILRLSFDNLSSPSLKKCFAYCSIFPKGCRIVKQELIELWMAEGFLQADKRNDMESVGKKFFNVLVQNSLLLVAKRDKYGNVRSCVMHDLVHDLASSVLGSSNNAHGITPLRYMIYSFRDEPSPIPKHVAKHLRTLFLEGDISGTIFSDFECLHVLILDNYGVEELPSSIRKLIHLRNLNISKTRIKNLPDWIGEFHHLQTLTADTEHLKRLPSTLKYLINLRHLYIDDDVELPAKIGRLTSLQTLTRFTVGDDKGYRIEELGSLKNLKGKLKIRNLEKVHDKEEAKKANIFKNPNLFELWFEWDGCREGETNDESVLEGLQPHANLKKLGIAGFKGKRFPLWTEKMAVGDGPRGSWVPLSKLIEITLSECAACEEIPRLEHLPNLKYLYLIGLKKVRFINSPFSKLLSLYIEELDRLECLPDWLFYNNQNLSELRIRECPKLRELPDGLHTLDSLEELIIWKCPNLKRIGNPSGGGGGLSQGILRRLWIGLCGGLIELPHQMIESWAPSLESLVLEELSSLKNLPMVMDCLANSARLRELKIVGVPKFMPTCSVESWPFGSLWRLEIDVRMEWSRESSLAIKESVDGILQGCCNSLTRLELKGMENWEWVPTSIQHLTALSSLVLKNLGVEELPQWFGNLSSLRDLSLYSCKRLRLLPSGDVSLLLSKLRHLSIKDCPKLCIHSHWRKIPHLTIQVDGRSI